MEDEAHALKREIVLKRLQGRTDERQINLSKKKEDEDRSTSKLEDAEYFNKTFEEETKTLRSLLAESKSLEQNVVIDFFDGVTQKLIKLQKFVTDSSFFLTNHQLERAQSTLSTLSGEISLLREELLPKKKFAFKNKKKQTAKNGDPQDTELTGYSVENSSLIMSANEFRIENKTDVDLSYTSSDVGCKDIVVSNIFSTKLTIKGALTAIHITDAYDSTIICGPCSRSILIERCRNCTFVLACQQLRIHEAVESIFYIHVTSKAIIENSQGLKFSPYSLTYHDRDNDFSAAGLNRSINNWSDVDDFNWLVKDKQSPNWSILSNDDRRSFEYS